jgi:hypothetical protein
VLLLQNITKSEKIQALKKQINIIKETETFYFNSAVKEKLTLQKFWRAI